MPKSTTLAPSGTVYRTDVVANDDVATVSVHEGLRTDDYEYTHFVVVPTGGTDPDASIYYWNEDEEVWALDLDTTAVSGVGGSVPYAFSVRTLGRTVFVALSAIRTLTDQGDWDADTNDPSLASGVGTDGDWYTVSVAGATDLDGIDDWAVGDIVLYDTDAWIKTTAPAGAVSINANTFGFKNRI